MTSSTYADHERILVPDFLDERSECVLLGLAKATLDQRADDLDEAQSGSESRRTLRIGFGLGGKWRGHLPGWLDVLREHAEARLLVTFPDFGMDRSAKLVNFDCAAIYEYAAGSRRGPHNDDRCFVNIAAIVTLGGSALVTLRDRDGQHPRSFVATRRSLYVLHGTGYSDATHEVECAEARTAIAFRRCDPRVAETIPAAAAEVGP